MSKERLSASVDAELLAAGRRAVAEGRFENMSAWVNDALWQRAELDEKLRGLDEWIAEFEAEFGEITEGEMRESRRWVEARAIRVRRERDVA